jgi:hypothetical protein
MTEESGYLCPFCGQDNSPLGAPCLHFFCADNPEKIRHSDASRAVEEAAESIQETLFRYLLYTHPILRTRVRIQRAEYRDIVETCCFSADVAELGQRFEEILAVERAKHTRAA